MNLEAKKQNLLSNLEQLRTRIAQLNQELQQRAAQEQQTLGALMIIEELAAEVAGDGQQKTLSDDAQG